MLDTLAGRLVDDYFSIYRSDTYRYIENVVDHTTVEPRRRTTSRPLGRGDLRLLLLSLIGERPCHGYELIQRISDMFVRAYTPSAGSVYPVLAQFETDGWVHAEEDGGRKRYRISVSGQTELRTRDADVQAALLRTRLSARAIAKANAPVPIREAMQELKRALMLRHGRWQPEHAERVALALRTAAALIQHGDGG